MVRYVVYSVMDSGHRSGYPMDDLQTAKKLATKLRNTKLPFSTWNLYSEVYITKYEYQKEKRMFGIF